MTPDTKGIEALLAALNRSAERLQGLWFSFMALTLYLMITALTTTHRMLLLEEPQLLPLINLKVPLLPFYVISPILYWILHFYVLMMLVLLSRSADELEKNMATLLPRESERETFRMRAENSLFLQILIGAKEERQGFNGKLLVLIAFITLAIAPIITIVVIQMKFLPYHHLQITWFHRIMVFCDVFTILFLWRSFMHRKGIILPSWFVAYWCVFRSGKYWSDGLEKMWRNWRFDFRANMSLIFSLLLTFWLTVWEGRWAGEPLIDPEKIFSHRLLIDNNIFSDRLQLINQKIVTDEIFDSKINYERKDEENSHIDTFFFGGRNFDYADFTGADLRGTKFSSLNKPGGILFVNDFVLTSIKHALFYKTNLDSVDFSLTNLSGSVFSDTHIRNAKFLYTRSSCLQINDVMFEKTNWRGSIFVGANFSNTDIVNNSFDNSSFLLSNFFELLVSRSNFKGSSFLSNAFQATDFSTATFGGSIFEGNIFSQNYFVGSDLYLNGSYSDFGNEVFFQNSSSKNLNLFAYYDSHRGQRTSFRANSYSIGKYILKNEEKFLKDLEYSNKNFNPNIVIDVNGEYIPFEPSEKFCADTTDGIDDSDWLNLQKKLSYDLLNAKSISGLIDLHSIKNLFN